MPPLPRSVASHTSLAEVREQAACETCSAQFGVDLSRTLEVVFSPHPSVRTCEVRRFCIGGPANTPHIVIQRLLAPGERHEARVRLPPGRYRVRFSGEGGLRLLDVVEGAAAHGAQLALTPEGVEGLDARLEAGAELSLTLANRGARHTLAVVETAAWLQDALMACELLLSPRDSDLFGAHVLAPGVQLATQRVAVLFTDLVGSTALYRQLGDARAFRFVWGHFDALRTVLEREGGVLVKTIGDAVMAVFLEPAAALRAAAGLHAAMAGVSRREGLHPSVGLRVGLACGPAFAVTLNERLDYFGTTVNLAARVQGESRGGDVLAPAELVAEAGGPGALLADGWRAEEVSLSVKGFESPVTALRFTRESRAQVA